MNFYPPQTLAQAPQVAVANFPPALPGLLGRTCNEMIGCGLHPTIVTSQLLAFTSQLTQSIANVKWPNEHVSPIGANVYLRAPSGTGKSVVLRHLMNPVTSALAKRRCRDATEQPTPAFFVEDVTRVALVEHLAEWSSAGLFTDEAGQCKMLLIEAAPTLAKLLDGESLNSARARQVRIKVSDPRLTILWMEQPGIDGVGKQLFETKTAHVGVVNRLFVAEAQPFNPHQAHGTGSLPMPVTRNDYAARATSLLQQSVQQIQAGQERPCLTLSTDAQSYLTHMQDAVQRGITSHSVEPATAKYVTRHAERCLRLAAAFHVFEHGNLGQIQVHELAAADAIGQWSIGEFMRMTYVPPKQPQAQMDAFKLLQSLTRIWQTTGQSNFPHDDVQLTAVNLGLTKARFDRALAHLCEQRQAWVTRLPNKMRLICLNAMV